MFVTEITYFSETVSVDINVYTNACTTTILYVDMNTYTNKGINERFRFIKLYKIHSLKIYLRILDCPQIRTMGCIGLKELSQSSYCRLFNNAVPNKCK